MTQSPDEKVAEKITAALREKKLVAESRMADLAKRLVAGGLTSAEWLWIAKTSLDEETKGRHVDPN